MIRSVLLAAALAAPPLAFAEEPAPSPPAFDPVVVTATGTETRLSETLASVSVITREQIEHAQVGDIAELLRFVAGVEIARNGGPGAVTSVFIRGGESNHTLVLIDGTRVNPATAGGAALQNLTPEMIERIEVLRGPRATLYGSDAIAGVINIITRSPAGLHADAAFRGGSYRTFDEAGSVSLGGDDAGAALSAQHQETDGFPSCRGAAEDRGYRNTAVQLKSTVRIGATRLGLRGWDARGQSEYFDFCGGGSPIDQDFHNQVLAADAVFSPLRDWQSTFGLSRMVDDIRQNQPNFLGQLDYVRTVRPRATWDNTLQLAAQKLTLGLEAAREDVDAQSFGTLIHDDRDLAGAFAQDQINVGPHGALLAVAWEHHEAFGNQVTWNAEYGYRFATGTRVSASAGSGFRAPDATDRYGFGGNPDLKPEKSRSYELGVQQALPAGQSLELRGFWTDVEDLINVVCVSGCEDADFTNDVFQAQNLDRFRNRGAELSYRIIQDLWSAHVSAVRQQPRDRATGARLLRRADRTLSAGGELRLGRFELGLEGLASGERADFGGPRLPGYVLLDFNAGVHFGSRWRLRARVENLLDTDYQTAAGYNQAGLSAYGTLLYSY